MSNTRMRKFVLLVVLAKGYGYADIEAHTPVDPAQTLFRLGSVSKLFVVDVGGAAIAVGFWPAAAWFRWHDGVTLASGRRIPALGRWAAWLGSLALAGFVVGVVGALADPMQVVYGLPASTRALFSLPLVAIPLTLGALLGAIRAWRSQRSSVAGRVAFTILVLAMALLIWQLNVWNLVGFHD